MTADMTRRHIMQFRGSFAFLSNFHPAPLLWEGITYPTSEHAFNAGKTTEPYLRAWIADAETPREAKRRGHQVRLRDGWDATVRYEVMRAVLRAKFTGEQRINALLGTGDAVLVEGNTWHDQHWGDCTCGRQACKTSGVNYLGRMLTELREEVRTVDRSTATPPTSQMKG